MGNICGKEDKDNFSSPGRPLNSAAAPSTGPKKSSVPKSASHGPGRTLGGGSGGGGGASSNAPGPEGAATGPDEARRKAAEAAEVRCTMTYSLHLPTTPSSIIGHPTHHQLGVPFSQL